MTIYCSFLCDMDNMNMDTGYCVLVTVMPRTFVKEKRTKELKITDMKT